MKLSEYVTRARVAYYVAVAIVGVIVQTVAAATIGERGTLAVVTMLMWLTLVIDIKIVPAKISFIQPFLPGFTWLDLWVALLVYGGVAFLADYASQAADQREFMIRFLLVMGACCIFGVFGLLQWQRWRGQRQDK